MSKDVTVITAGRGLEEVLGVVEINVSMGGALLLHIGGNFSEPDTICYAAGQWLEFSTKEHE